MMRSIIFLSLIFYFATGKTQVAVIYSDHKCDTRSNFIPSPELMVTFKPAITSSFYSLHSVHQTLFIKGIQYPLLISFFGDNNLPGSFKAVYLPSYTQGPFCDFEDHINRNRKLRIDFSVR
ncbi:MAG: hypothetical protein ACHQFW_00285 [Chitinophagales bacterium]